LLAHLWQAGRNERLAKQLLEELIYKEWVVTVAFYSGLHYVEAALNQEPTIVHSETSIPNNYQGGLHDWREDLVLQYFPSAWSSYRKLRTQSIVARYLSTNRRAFLQQPVEDYFSEQDVHNFVHRDLDKVRRKLGL
jgi:hypothetical protein